MSQQSLSPSGTERNHSGEQTGGAQLWEGVPPGGASGVALEEGSPATGDPPVWSEKELSLGKADGAQAAGHVTTLDPHPQQIHSLGEQEVSSQ